MMKKLLNNIELYVASICLFVMLVITFANVMGRMLLPVAWSFTEELTCGLFILVSLFGAASVAKDGEHLGLSALTDLLPQKFQKYVTVLQSFFTSIFSVMLLIYGSVMVFYEIEGNIKTASLGIPEAVYGSFVPIGAFFITIRTVQCAIERFRKARKKICEGDSSE